MTEGITTAAPIPPPKSTEPAPNAPSKNQRFVFLDGLRGLAALMVVSTHLITGSISHRQLARYTPRFIDHFMDKWMMGVPIFFVLSGFVIAYSQRGVRVTPSYLGNFAIRRSLRLDPPYWLAIALTDISIRFYRRFMVHPWAVAHPLAILCNMFYLQNILHTQIIVGPSWTLCFEVQFYLTLTILVGIAQTLPYFHLSFLGWRNAPFIVVFIPLALASLWVDYRGNRIPFVPAFWWMFFLGVMLWWNRSGLVSTAWLLIYILAIAGLLVVAWNPYNVVAFLTGLTIFAAGRTGGLMTWLRWRWIQFFGAISYSLYLTHDIFAPLQYMGNRLFHQSFFGAWFTLVVVFAISVGFSWLMYRFVERTGIALGNRFKPRRQDKQIKPEILQVPSAAVSTLP